MTPASMPRRCLAVLLFGLAVVPALAPAPAPAGGESPAYKDEKFGFSLSLPRPWKPARLEGFAVPGTVRAAWSGPAGASVVAFVQEPGKAFSPRFLLDASARAMKDKLGARVLAKEVRTIGGMRAMWLAVQGKGTGAALDGKGNVETSQLWVAIPRTQDVVVLLLTSRAADYEANRKSFEKALDTLKLKGSQNAQQRAAK